MTGSSTGGGSSVRRFHPAPDAGTRLICFPHAGGSSTYFFPMSRALSPAVDVLALQYPGRQDRQPEPCVDDLKKLAGMLVQELLQWTDRPFVLFGHSMGATLAFEVALGLARDGVTPQGLFVSGRRAPSRFRDERVHLYTDAEFLADLKRLSGTDPQMFDDDVLGMILPALRSDYRAAESYRYQPGPRLSCRIVAPTREEHST